MYIRTLEGDDVARKLCVSYDRNVINVSTLSYHLFIKMLVWIASFDGHTKGSAFSLVTSTTPITLIRPPDAGQPGCT